MKNDIFNNYEEITKKIEEEKKERDHQSIKNISNKLDKENEKVKKFIDDSLNLYADRLLKEKESEYQRELEEAKKKAQEEIDNKYQKDPVTEGLRELIRNGKL